MKPITSIFDKKIQNFKYFGFLNFAVLAEFLTKKFQNFRVGHFWGQRGHFRKKSMSK